MPEGTIFFPFAEPGKLREGMTKGEQDKTNKKTEQAKSCLHACGRKEFSNIKQIAYDFFIWKFQVRVA